MTIEADVDSQLQFRVGTDILPEFVAGHSVIDVVRELVQNEFDGGGQTLEVTFGKDALEVVGSGRAIDASGWRRLSVMLSTGSVAGPGRSERIPPKVNGIGSKNMGMRTLFLFGPRIEVYSDGLMTVLDMRRGTLPRPVATPEGTKTRGVLIRVRYRTKNEGRLTAFTVDREARAFREMKDAMAMILPKLALPGTEKGLRRMVVRSVRTGSRLEWRQSARVIQRLASGIQVVQRDVHLAEADVASEREILARRELAFEMEIARPILLRREDVPSYFSSVRGRLRIGVSLVVVGNRVRTGDRGRFYYPIVAPMSASGNGISVSAPFLMNEDRTDLIDHPANDALQHAAADLVKLLLRTDWLDRFGPVVLAACDGTVDASAFASSVQDTVRDEPVWPTTELRRGKPRRERAANLLINEIPGERFIDAGKYPVEAIEQNQQLVAMLRRFGAARFTINSVVRLWCAPKDDSALETDLREDEANVYYENYEISLGGIRGLLLQQRMARSLEGRRLSAANRSDLATSRSTLAADGSLAVLEDLWFVPAGVEPPGLAASSRLHAGLSPFTTLTRVAREYTPDRWVQDVCGRALEGEASPREMEGLYRYMVSGRATFTPRAVAAIRRSPVLKDHRGAWVSGSDLVHAQTPGARFAEPVLSFPSPELRRRPRLLRRFAIRSKLRRADIIALAESIDSPDESQALVSLLKSLPSLATAPLLSELSQIPCIPTSSGTIDTPTNLYVDEAGVRSLIPKDALFATRIPTTMQRRLGCRDEATSSDIVARIRQDREAGTGKQEWAPRVMALVAAARRERKLATQFTNELVCYVSGHGWIAPAKVLTGSNLSTVFSDLPIVKGPVNLVEALSALGAARRPLPSHWASAMRLISAPYEAGARLRKPEVDQLRRLYGRLAALEVGDIGIGPREKYLLSTAGTLHDRHDAAARRFVINDEPTLAASVVRQKVSIALADDHENSQLFFRDLDIPKLTEMAKTATVVKGAERPLPPGPGTSKVLDSIHSQDLASALAAVVRVETVGMDQRPRPSTDIARRLGKIDRVIGVESIRAHVRVANVQVELPRTWSVANATLYIASPSGYDDVLSAASAAVADLLDIGASVTPRMVDAAYRLIGRNGPAMQTYLLQRGVDWKPSTRRRGGAESDTDLPIEVIQAALAAALAQGSSGTRAQGTEVQRRDRDQRDQKPVLLPLIEEVDPTFEVAGIEWTPPDRKKGHGGGSGGSGAGGFSDPERDLAIGRRGEEIVLNEERRRLAARGQDPALAVWVGDAVPGADHDIQSVDAKGRQTWLEVKSTTGSDGRFHWPIQQVTLAITQRERYILYRVYGVASTNPVVRAFPDPIKLLSQNRLRVDVSTLVAEVEPLGGEVES